MAEIGAGRDRDGAVGQGVLGRMLQARDRARLDDGGAPALPRPQPVTVARAAATAVGRAADRLYQLPARPLEVAPAAITLAEMAELLPQPGLLSVVEGPGEALGVVAICPVVMTALIEVQTLGRITARPCDKRRPTRSDGMICADFVNALLDELEREITQVDGFDGFSGFRYASFMDDQRPLLMMLEDAPYRSLRLRLRLGDAPAREGEIFLALPQKQDGAALPALTDQRAASGGQKPVPDRAGGASDAGAGALGDLAEQMRAAPVEVTGILCRRTIRLGDLRQLQRGQILPLSHVNLAETRLETRLGQLLALGKLGEADGYHAIRLRKIGEAAETVTPPSSLPLAPATPASSEPPMADLDLPDHFRNADAVESGTRRRIIDGDPASKASAEMPHLLQKGAISG